MKLVKPKKFLGQHFLKDLKVAQDIADTVDTFPDLPILEVGPGMGVLTQFLVKKERLVKVVEELIYKETLTDDVLKSIYETSFYKKRPLWGMEMVSVRKRQSDYYGKG